MARPLRISYPNAFYHVTCRGNERRAIFANQILILQSVSSQIPSIIQLDPQARSLEYGLPSGFLVLDSSPFLTTLVHLC
jgi:hypothetical protein